MNSADWQWPAPAKLNLFLHITGRRADGYHLLQTVFQFIDYSDTIRYHPRADGSIRRLSELAGVPAELDLVVRAAELLRRHVGIDSGIGIEVTKRLPMGGGLGGGSSDAATTLVALNAIWRCGLSVDTLAALGLQLGADVPVFVRGHAAWAEGVGEQIVPVTLPEPWFVVVVPDAHVETRQIFNASDLTRNKHPIKIRDFLEGPTENVCQSLVSSNYPEVAKALEWLAQFGQARMTGTGACVFAAFPTERAALDAAERKPAGWQVIVAKGLNENPLRVMLRQYQAACAQSQ